MKTFIDIISCTSATLGACTGYFIGGFDCFLYALLTFVVIDYITGVMLAIINKKLSSKIGFKGIFKKVLIFLFVGVAHILDTKIIGYSSVLRTTVIFFYLSNEGVSIIENVTLIGLPIPEKLKLILKQLREEKDEDDNENEQ